MTSKASDLRRTKMTLLGVTFSALGMLLMALTRWLDTLSLGSWSWLQASPFAELGASLFGIGVAVDSLVRRQSATVLAMITHLANLKSIAAKKRDPGTIP